MKKETDFYSKFLTDGKAKNQQSPFTTSTFNQVQQLQKKECKELNQNTIHNANNQQEESGLSHITYGLFVNQTKEKLFQTFFKNQQDNIENQTKKVQKSAKINHLKTKQKELTLIKNKEDKLITEKKRKEYYEDIIKANRDCIRINPFLNQEEDNIRKFEIEHLNPDNVVEIEIENEVKIKKEQTEQKHKEILSAKIPEIFEKIKAAETNKYFIYNKYKEAIDNFGIDNN